MDPAKLKVVDLRQELQKRGLDTKGNKAVLVKRLQDALDQEPNTDSGNAPQRNDPPGDDTSHNEEEEAKDEEQPPEETKSPIRERRSSRESRSLREPKTPKKELKPVKEEPSIKPEPKNKGVKVSPQKAEPNICGKEELVKPIKAEVKKKPEPVKEEVGSPVKKDKLDVKEETRKEAVADVIEEENPTESIAEQEQNEDENAKSANGEEQSEEVQESPEEKAKEQENGAEQMETETRGEKRKREEADGPERPTKRREKSPIREDEPEIDPDKPQLSWFDSDLHLKIDKETFLSAKPMNDNCFGFVWAGSRATHGISSGKICYEVKITEEMVWEDPSKYMGERKDRSNKYRLDNRRDRKTEEKSEESQKNEEENQEKTEETRKNEEEYQEKNDENNKDPGDNAEGKSENDESGEKMEAESENTNTNKTDGENTEQADADNTEAKESDNKEEAPKPEEAESSEKMETQTEETKEKSEENAEQSEEKVKPDPIPTHYFRVGFSALGTSLQLGEDKYSYGYESTGKFVTDKQFSDYGIGFGVGDVVGAYLNIDAENVTITYTVNGVLQPTALNVPLSELPQENFVLFPHVLCRNYAYELNFGSKPEPWFAHPEELKGYVYLQSAEEKVAGPSRPATRSECEVILMVGLPGSGKTHWVKNHIESSPLEKAYNVIGNKSILERMTVDGEPLKSRFSGSWKVLVDRIQKVLNTLTDLAAQRRRNYIIDQTNVFPNAQRRKLRPFDGFQRKAVVVVCGQEELERRHALHETDYGKSVPESTMLDLKAQMELPIKCDWLDELIFPELNEEEAKKKVKEFNDEANKKGYFRRWHNQQGDRRNFRGGYRDRGYSGGRYDRYDRHQGGWSRPAGGGWGRDRRDARGPPPPRAGGRDAWRPVPYRASARPQDRAVRGRDNRNSSGTGGYGWGGRSQEGGRTANAWQSGGGSWGSGGGGGWNAQMYGAHGYGAWNQQAWKYGGGQAGGYNAQSGSYGTGNYGSYGQSSGQSAAGYGGQNWNYYGQYNQQAQGWAQQKRN